VAESAADKGDFGMTDQPDILIEAFDARGIHCGSAHRLPDGRWSARITATNCEYRCDTEEAAESWLRLGGAKLIVRGSGLKDQVDKVEP